jgi:isopenicillin N synthase-like dioxygenase
MRNPVCTTRLLHYPPHPAQAAPGQIGCGAHTDWGALTLLAQDTAGGLQVAQRDGTWLDIPPLPGTFIVNSGDMMARWTNDRWASTLHRVVNPPVGLAQSRRLSIGMFVHPNYDQSIACVPTCVAPGAQPRHAAITAGEHIKRKIEASHAGA